MKIRLGVIGLGDEWSTLHAPALHALADRFEVRGVCEQVAHRAKLVAEEFGAATVGGYQAMMRREDIDAVLILAEQWYGPLPIIAACEHQKAVYCAACFDLPLKEAEKIRRQVDRSGIAFMAEFLRRYMPATLRLKELIATQLGEPRLLFCTRRLGLDSDRRKRNGRSSAHSTERELIELVDWCRYLVAKEPTGVTGLSHAAETDQAHADNGSRNDACEEYDYREICLDFSDPDSPGVGPLAHISCNRYFPDQWREAVHYRTPAELQIVCQKGMAFLDLPATLIWYDDAGRHQERLDLELPVGEQLLTHFFRAVTSLVRNRSDLEDAYRALAIVKQAERSALEGRRITLKTEEM